MSNLKTYFVEQYVKLKTMGILKQLDRTPVMFPIKADVIKNVLVILPRSVEYVDAAVSLVRKLRKIFSRWNFMMLDIDKIKPADINRLGLPNQAFMDDLHKKNFEMVLDLNFDFDIRIAYLVALLEIKYRLHPHTDREDFYNIAVNAHHAPVQNYDFVLHHVERIFN
jgi:hypothetical protein